MGLVFLPALPPRSAATFRQSFLGIAILVSCTAAVQARHDHPRTMHDGSSVHGELHRWLAYRDPISGTAIEFPSDVFSVEAGDPEQGLGKMFRTSDGRAQLSIYALPNDANESPTAYLKKHLLVD